MFVTVPSAALPPITPFTSQTTAVPGATQSEAAKFCISPSGTAAEAGATPFAPVHPIPTLAEADFDGSATLVAVTLTVGGDGKAPGAVYIAESPPFDTIVPFAASPPLTLFTLQFTAVAGLPELVTLAVNPCVPPNGSPAASGEMPTTISLVIVTLAVSLALASAALVAVTVTFVAPGIVDGALYSPAAEIVPDCAFPPATPFTLQLTDVFVAPVTLA